MRNLAPTTMQELHTALAEMTPQSKLIAGGSDLIIRLGMGLEPDALLYVCGVPELRRMEHKGDTVEIGAAVTMTELAEWAELPLSLRALADAAADVGSKQIRNSGTVGGNVGNASAAGDMLPVLFLLRADVDIATANGTIRRVPIHELVVGPMKTTLAVGEAIVRFIIPVPPSPTRASAFVKLGSRKALTISRIGLCISIDRDSGGNLVEPEVVVGAISLTPVHVQATEEWLPGKPLDAAAARHVGQSLSDLIMKITPEKFDRDYKVGAAFGVAEDVVALLSAR